MTDLQLRLSAQVLQFGIMKLRDFSYSLPAELIAERPATMRSASRLLSLNCSSGVITHSRFSDLYELLRPRDLLVFNDTRVIPARLFAQKSTGGKVELLLERIRSQTTALVQIRASKSTKPGTSLHLLNHRQDRVPSKETLIVSDKDGDFYEIRTTAGKPIAELLEQYGHMPLPPYIRREADSDDKMRYQTVYSRKPGAVAAPTAGLHFDEQLLDRLRDKGVNFAYLTLHVGAGTFQSVRVELVEQHTMHKERIEVPIAVCESVDLCKSQGGRVVAVGTTTVRSLEAAAAKNIKGSGLQPYSGETDIFIYPGFRFQVIDAMVTNFHLPESTLLMLVSAYAGKKRLLDAYSEAIKEKYRFFSFGDAMFLHRG